MESMAAVAIWRFLESSIWPSGFSGIHVAPHLQDVGGHGVPGRVVGAHGARGIGDADALDGPGIVGGHGLALHHRYPLHAEDLAR